MFEIKQRDLDRYGEFEIELEDLGKCLVVFSMYGIGECLSVYKLGELIYEGICENGDSDFEEDEDYFYIVYNGMDIDIPKHSMYY